MRTRIIIPVAAILAAILLSFVCTSAARASITLLGHAPDCGENAANVAEDHPCWTWTRQGNRKRGVVTVNGTPLIVGPCGFARLYRARVIRYAVTVGGKRYPLMDRLRGDQWALAHGCQRPPLIQL